jgi:hypothetical protein
LIDQLLEVLTGLEVWHALGRNADRLASFGIAATPRTSATYSETAKTAKFNLLALVQTLNDAIENDFHQSLSVLLGKLSSICYVIDKIGFSHAVTSSKKLRLKDELVLDEHDRKMGLPAD